MSSKKYRKFSREQKMEAIRLLESGTERARDIASGLGIHENTLYKWRSSFTERGETAFPGKGVRHKPLSELEAAEQEIARLQQQLHEREQDCNILKKALSIVSHRSK